MTPETFLSNPVHQKLMQLNEVLASKNGRSAIDIPRLAFFETAYNYIKGRLDLALPLLIYEGGLNPIWAEVESATQQINEFIGNGNDGHLQNAIDHLNSAVNTAKSLPVVSDTPESDPSKQVADFQKIVQDKYNELEIENARLKEDLSAFQLEILNNQKQLIAMEGKISEIDLTIQNQLLKFKTDFENIQNTNANNLEIDRNRLIEKFEMDRKKIIGQIEDDRKNFKDQIETSIDVNENTFSNNLESFSERSDELINSTRKNFDETTQRLRLKLEEANKIVNVIGDIGVTGNYQIIANQHKKDADIFRYIAIAFMVVMSALLIYSIVDLSTADFNLYKSLVRILATAVLTYPAIYAARESTKHRTLETYNRNLELELAAIGPFIEMLDEEKKQKIKEDLVCKYFGNQADQLKPKDSDDDVSINGLEKILKVILPMIKK